MGIQIERVMVRTDLQNQNRLTVDAAGGYRIIYQAYDQVYTVKLVLSDLPVSQFSVYVKLRKLAKLWGGRATKSSGAIVVRTTQRTLADFGIANPGPDAAATLVLEAAEQALQKVSKT